MRGSITILVDNIARKSGLKAEHGLSMFIEVDGHALLFDTGQSGLVIDNARALGVDLTRVEAIILSHGHYDHVGGLTAVLDYLSENSVSPPVIFAHPDVFVDRYSFRKGKPVKAGMSSGEKTREQLKPSLKLSEKSQEILPGVICTGEIPRLTEFEHMGGRFSLDAARKRPDYIRDDQAVIIDAPEGLIVCCGCAHSGVVNTIRYAQNLFEGKSIDTVIGGMHLRGVSDARLDATVGAFVDSGVKQVLGGHCTGVREAERISSAMPNVYPPLEVGLRWEFGV
jgi:7,8-dihydropterin-6-yl-methyl-4-(beta-D-ribofuranosyl)aminobenzene 5'-phosphate synthase